MDSLTVQEVAKKLNLSHDTVVRLVRSGVLKGKQKNPFARTSPFLIPVREVDRIIKVMQNEQTIR